MASIFYTEGITEAKYFSAFYQLVYENAVEIWLYKYSAENGNSWIGHFNHFDRFDNFDQNMNPPTALLRCIEQRNVSGCYVVVDDDVYENGRRVDGYSKQDYQDSVERTHNTVLWQGRNFEDFVAMQLPDDKWNMWQDWCGDLKEINANGHEIKAALNKLIETEVVADLYEYERLTHNILQQWVRENQGRAPAYEKWWSATDPNKIKYFLMGLVRCKLRLVGGVGGQGNYFGWVDMIKLEDCFTADDFQNVLEELERGKDEFFRGDRDVVELKMVLKKILKDKANATDR